MIIRKSKAWAITWMCWQFPIFLPNFSCDRLDPVTASGTWILTLPVPIPSNDCVQRHRTALPWQQRLTRLLALFQLGWTQGMRNLFTWLGNLFELLETIIYRGLGEPKLAVTLAMVSFGSVLMSCFNSFKLMVAGWPNWGSS